MFPVQVIPFEPSGVQPEILDALAAVVALVALVAVAAFPEILFGSVVLLASIKCPPASVPTIGLFTGIAALLILVTVTAFAGPLASPAMIVDAASGPQAHLVPLKMTPYPFSSDGLQ
jgi:hypothetical protein